MRLCSVCLLPKVAGNENKITNIIAREQATYCQDFFRYANYTLVTSAHLSEHTSYYS